MPIEELQEPIWEKQKGETPNQYCYFLEFLQFPTYNLKDFHDHLCENGIAGHKGTKIAAYKTLRNWAGDSCNKWHSRKEAKRIADKEDLLETLHELDKQDAIEEYLLKKSIKRKLLKRLEKEADYEKYSQLKHGADAEEPTTFTNQKLDVDAETKIEYEGVENLLEVFHASKDEWDKRKSQ